MRLLDTLYAFVFVIHLFNYINLGSSQCTFGSTFASSTWHDNTKGTLTFTTTRMSGWSFTSTRDTGSSTIQQWQCHDHTNDNYLILRTTSTFLFQTTSSTVSVYGYLCLQLTSVTQYSFIYYQQQVQEINLGGERIRVSDVGTLTLNDVCDTSINLPQSEYHVLVKSGSEASAAIQCPDNLLFSADYYYINNDNTQACTGSSDVWNMCNNKKQMTFNYNRCSQQIAFSAEGNFYCVANVFTNGYDFTTVYNRDATLTSSTSQFACLSFSNGHASVAPGNCTAFQTPFSFPLEADQTTKIGHRLVVSNVYEDCGPSTSSGLSPGAIAGIVISVLFFIAMVTTYIMTTIFIILAIFAARTFFVILLDMSGFIDYIPRTINQTSPVLSITNDFVDEKTKSILDSVKITTPSSVILNGMTNGGNPLVHASVKKKPT
ncbi:hypothetical protein ACF0H5_010608 [Mactra antiquata]